MLAVSIKLIDWHNARNACRNPANFWQYASAYKTTIEAECHNANKYRFSILHSK